MTGADDTMKLHNRHQYGELAEVLDAAMRHYLQMDAAADAHGYQDEARNARAERAAARYDRLKAQAGKLHAQRPGRSVRDVREVEVLPV